MKRLALVLIFAVSLFAVIYPASLHAQSPKEELPPMQRLEKLLRDLEVIEKEGHQILEQQNATLDEINNLKIWARKR